MSSLFIWVVGIALLGAISPARASLDDANSKLELKAKKAELDKAKDDLMIMLQNFQDGNGEPWMFGHTDFYSNHESDVKNFKKAFNKYSADPGNESRKTSYREAYSRMLEGARIIYHTAKELDGEISDFNQRADRLGAAPYPTWAQIQSDNRVRDYIASDFSPIVRVDGDIAFTAGDLNRLDVAVRNGASAPASVGSDDDAARAALTSYRKPEPASDSKKATPNENDGQTCGVQGPSQGEKIFGLAMTGLMTAAAVVMGVQEAHERSDTKHEIIAMSESAAKRGESRMPYLQLFMATQSQPIFRSSIYLANSSLDAMSKLINAPYMRNGGMLSREEYLAWLRNERIKMVLDGRRHSDTQVQKRSNQELIVERRLNALRDLDASLPNLDDQLDTIEKYLGNLGSDLTGGMSQKQIRQEQSIMSNYLRKLELQNKIVTGLQESLDDVRKSFAGLREGLQTGDKIINEDPLTIRATQSSSTDVRSSQSGQMTGPMGPQAPGVSFQAGVGFRPNGRP